MLSAMRRRSTAPTPDVFETFAHRVEEDGTGRGVPRPATLARSAGVGLGLTVLACLAFVGGAWAAASHRPDVALANPLWEGLAVGLWSALWGALAGAATFALGVVVVGLPWARRQRARSTSTSAP